MRINFVRIAICLATLLLFSPEVFANFSGVAETFYNGAQIIRCDTCSPIKFIECPQGMYRLWEVRPTVNGSSVIIHTKRSGSSNGTTEFLNSNADWTSGSWNLFDRNHQAALDVHFATSVTIDYFAEVHGRDGVDDGQLSGVKGGRAVPIITSSVSFAPGVGAIFPSSEVQSVSVKYGYGVDSSDTDHYSSLDIVAHELGHLVNRFSGLAYSYCENGAMHEGFADIWGVCVKNYANEKYDLNKDLWKLGYEIMRPIPPNNYAYIRNLANPKCSLVYDYNHTDTLKKFRYPNTYKGDNWSWSKNNLGHRHKNGSIMSHWFYLLSVGGSDTNDRGEVYNVNGIGIHKAEKIAYRTLDKYLDNSSQYIDARDKSIQAAIDLFGVCSEEMKATVEAWYAVGLERAIYCGSKFYVDYLCRHSTRIDRLLKPEGITDFTGGKWYIYNLDDTNRLGYTGDSVVQLDDYYQYTISKYLESPDSTHINIYFVLGDIIHYWRFEITDETGLISRYYQDSSSTVIVNPDGKSGSFFVEFNEEGEMEESCIPLNCKTIYGSTKLSLRTQ